MLLTLVGLRMQKFMHYTRAQKLVKGFRTSKNWFKLVLQIEFIETWQSEIKTH